MGVIIGGLDAEVAPQSVTVKYCVKQTESLHSSKVETQGSTLIEVLEDGGSVIIGRLDVEVTPQSDNVEYCVKQTESLHSSKVETHGSMLTDVLDNGELVMLGGVIETLEVVGTDVEQEISVYEVAQSVSSCLFPSLTI